MLLKRSIPLALIALLGAACSTPRPVLYPNQKYKEVGPEIAQADIDACMALAKTHGADELPSGGSEVAGGVLEDAATGGATGAAAGAVWGNAGRGAGAGAAGYAAGGLVRRLFRMRRQADAGLMLFVDRCLREKGYESIGWK